MKELFEINKPFKKYLPLYMIMLSIILLMGTSYALLKSSHQGENAYTMNVGTLQVTFTDSSTNTLTLENAYPVTDEEGISNTNELSFIVKNTGNVEALYSVYIEETSTSPEFKSVIRFISNKNDTGYNSPKTLSDDKYIDSDSYLGINETASYKVKTWISEDATSTYMNKTFTARIVVDSSQYNVAELLKSKLKTKQTSSCKTYLEEDGITYVSGTSDCINFNYVWYSGKLWRITAINSDGTVKMITDDVITTISYGSDVNFYDISKKDDSTYTGSYIYQWLNEDFLDTLYNHENIIVEDSTWNITNSNASSESDASTKLASTTLVNNSSIGKDTPVGLLNSYEYYLSFKNTTYSNGYLNIGYAWWLLNPFNSSKIWFPDLNGGINAGSFSRINSVRPVIILKSNILFSSGTGTKDNPYKISDDKEEVVINSTLLNTRSIGEYVLFDEDGDSSTKELYRITGIEDGKVKLNKNDYVNDGTTTLTKAFGTSVAYGSGTTDSTWDYYLNNTWYSSLNNSSKNMITEGTYYTKSMALDSYKNSLCNTDNTTETTKNCERTTSTWSGLVGLPRYGEMFTSQQENGNDNSSDMWLINSYNSSNIWKICSYGTAETSAISSLYGVRPSIYLKSNIVITGGNGTKSNPFTIKLNS